MLQAIIFSIISFLGSANESKTTYSVDTKRSSVEWIAEKVTGQHNGTVSLKEGSFEFTEGKLTGGTFIMDMTTIVVTDLSGGSKTKLEGHLKNDDFFGVANYPTASFKITKAIPQGPGKYKIVGDITIKEKTEEIQFPASLEEKEGELIGSATLTVDRSKFDIRYRSGSFFDDLGDKTIYDNFDLTVKIVATK